MHAGVNCVCNVCGSTHSCGCMINDSFARAACWKAPLYRAMLSTYHKTSQKGTIKLLWLYEMIPQVIRTSRAAKYDSYNINNTRPHLNYCFICKRQ